MPRTKDMNKSEMVRQKLQEMGMDASPTEISRLLGAEGVKITPNAVSGIKIAMKKHMRKRGRRSAMQTEMPATTDNRPSIEEVYKVWALANQIGGNKLKQIVRHMP
jgi:hypothetical protein